MTARTPTVIEITILFKYDWRQLSRESSFRILNAIGRQALKAKQTDKAASYITVSRETASELVQRLRSQLDDLTFIENVWAQVVGRDATGLHGAMDPFQTFVAKAWAEVDRQMEILVKATPRQAQHVERARPPDARIEDRVEKFDDAALIDMTARNRWQRKKSRRPYDPER